MRGFVWPLVIRLSGVPDAPYFIWFLLPTGGMLSLVCLCLLTQLSRLNPFSLKPTIGSLQCPSVSLHCRSLLNPASQAFHPALTYLSHFPLPSGYDEPEILSYQIILFGPISADARQTNGASGNSTGSRHQ